MKIAVWHNLPSGGGRRAMHAQVAGLVAHGHTVHAWCPPTADTTYLPLASVGVPERVVPLPTVVPRRRVRDRLRPPSAEALRGAAMDAHSRAVAAEVTAAGCDLLLAHPCQAYAAPAIGRFVDVPSVLYLQEPNRQLYEAMPDLHWVAWPPRWRTDWRRAMAHRRRLLAAVARARAEVANAGAFDRILVNSLFSRESVLRAYGLDARACALGVDGDAFVDRGQPRERLVVGVGAIYPHKNVKLIVQAMARLAEPRPRLVWVGNLAHPGYLAELVALAAATGVPFEPRVMASDGELLDLLNRASVMAYAPRLEPFGYAPLEAGACGLPVVAVAEGGVRETVVDGYNGLWVEHDPAAMAAGIARVLGDPDLARRLGDNGKRWVRERYAPAVAADRLERHLADVVSGVA